MNFKNCLHLLRQTHYLLRQRAVSTIHQGLVVRNWLIGHYLAEFEQTGEDYAKYGERLVHRLSDELTNGGLKGMAYPDLMVYLEFYRTYPNLAGVIGKFLPVEMQFPTAPEGLEAGKLPAALLLKNLTFNHFAALLRVEDPAKRLFYETECIRCGWNDRQLRREIANQLYERTGALPYQESLLAQTQEAGKGPVYGDLPREPRTMGFLGLKMEAVLPEAGLHKALLDALQQFLLGLDNGFCLEARQKRVLIAGRRHKIDLLFYHRLLKCHVAVNLKTRRFKPEDALHLNLYLHHHRENDLIKGDNPPLGILLCTWKNEAIVRYATAALDKQLFVSRYLLQLPEESVLRDFLLREREWMGEV